MPSWLRKQLFRVFGRDAMGGDYVMREVIKSAEKRRIWWPFGRKTDAAGPRRNVRVARPR